MRDAGNAADFSYKPQGLGKQLKQASATNAKRCVILGQELESGQVAVKDLASGEQELIALESLLNEGA